jgi:DNA-binding FadR family transcriptional regulator
MSAVRPTISGRRSARSARAWPNGAWTWAPSTALVARSAAERFEPGSHAQFFDEAMGELGSDAAARMPGAFSRARRLFYRSLLVIGGNRELQRIFPAIGMHIIYSQYQTPELQHIRLADYRAIHDSMTAPDPGRAEQAGREHVEHVRMVIGG